MAFGFLRKAGLGVRNAAARVAIKLAIREVERDEEYGPMYSKVKAYINGKKTKIGAAIIAIPVAAAGLAQLSEALGFNASRVIGGVVLAIGLLHKAQKYLVDFGVVQDEDGDWSTEQ